MFNASDIPSRASSPGCRSSLFIHFDILPGRSVPGEIQFHATLLNLPPFRGVSEEVERPPHRRHQVGWRVAVELEAIPAGFGHILYRVGQPAGAPDDWDGPISEAVHLIESARL